VERIERHLRIVPAGVSNPATRTGLLICDLRGGSQVGRARTFVQASIKPLRTAISVSSA
jgi:hypothetical protein